MQHSLFLEIYLNINLYKSVFEQESKHNNLNYDDKTDNDANAVCVHLHIYSFEKSF